MWNGDGKPVLWTFRLEFFKEFMRDHPDCVLGQEEEYWQIFDCYEVDPAEELDCWYCDECKSLAVFAKNDSIRYDYLRMENIPDIDLSEVRGWVEYVAYRNKVFIDFMDYSEGLSPLEALEKFPTQFHCYLSPDKKMFYVFDDNGRVRFGYYLVRKIVWAKDKMELRVRPGKYAFTKDGRRFYIAAVLEAGKSYLGVNPDEKNAVAEKINHSDINSIADEICKGVIVE